LDHKTKNFLFLFGAAPMGMAGCLSSADDSDTLITLTTATTFNNDDEETSNGDGDGDSTAGDGDGDPTAGDGDGDSGDGDGDSGDGDGDSGDGDGDSGDGDGDSGDGDGDSGDGDGDSGDGDGDSESTTGDGDVGDLCTPYSEQIGECYGDQYAEMAYTYCAQYYEMNMGDPACFSAFETFIVCISQLSCLEFMDFTGCEDALTGYQTECF
jgi:hypothetical protein